MVEDTCETIRAEDQATGVSQLVDRLKEGEAALTSRCSTPSHGAGAPSPSASAAWHLDAPNQPGSAQAACRPVQEKGRDSSVGRARAGCAWQSRPPSEKPTHLDVLLFLFLGLIVVVITVVLLTDRLLGLECFRLCRDRLRLVGQDLRQVEGRQASWLSVGPVAGGPGWLLTFSFCEAFVELSKRRSSQLSLSHDRGVLGGVEDAHRFGPRGAGTGAAAGGALPAIDIGRVGFGFDMDGSNRLLAARAVAEVVGIRGEEGRRRVRAAG